MSPPEPSRSYRGRFAPSPSGPLHFGSLVTAVASYLQAKHNNGAWILRIEDLDPPREVQGAADRIINSLATHGFEWSEPILWQSNRLKAYEAAVQQLLANDLAYACGCTRPEIRARAKPGAAGLIYPGTCRTGPPPGRRALAVRVRTDDQVLQFTDRLQGEISCQLESEIGDYLVRRGDGLIAYHLAVVIDDHEQGITEVLRGTDLLDSTPVQIHLQRQLGLNTPDYLHIPIAINRQAQKLSKQTGAIPVDDEQAGQNLYWCLKFLLQDPPPELGRESAETVWQWAFQRWEPAPLSAERQIPAPRQYQ